MRRKKPFSHIKVIIDLEAISERKAGRKGGREKQSGEWKMIGSRHIWDKFLADQVEAPHNCFFCYLSTFRRKGK